MKKRPRQTRQWGPLDVAFGARIREVRLAQKPFVSQKWLAEEIGCALQQVQKYETGQNRISFSRGIKIARALDMDYIELILPVLVAAGIVQRHRRQQSDT